METFHPDIHMDVTTHLNITTDHLQPPHGNFHLPMAGPLQQDSSHSGTDRGI